jgi:hypothetical protein
MPSPELKAGFIAWAVGNSAGNKNQIKQKGATEIP